jgi:peptidoglycan/LPS O-acetylase OafA/YrhL
MSSMDFRGLRRKEIDGFRALAVIIVILSHLDFKSIPGQTGVLLFFVISGFVITASVLREVSDLGKFSIKNFYKRRAFKLLPPLFFIIILPSLFVADQIDAPAILSQIFFYFNWQYFKSSTEGILAGSQVVWSLSVEEQYYISIAIIVSLLVVLALRSFIKLLTLTYLLLYVYSSASRVVIYLNSGDQNEWGDVPRILYGTDTRMSSIAIGGLVAIYVQSKLFSLSHIQKIQKHKFLVHSSLFFMISFSVLNRDEFFRNSIKYVIQDIVCGVLIVMASNPSLSYRILGYLLRSKLLQLIGLASYSIYLSHLVLIVHFRNSSALSDLGITGLLEKVILFGIVVSLGTLLHMIVDKPFEKIRNSFR